MTTRVTLQDPSTNATVLATITADKCGINLGFAGYGDYSSGNGFGRPIFIELRDGQLTLRAWTDIRQEDPTHILSLENARESLRSGGAP
jgi:hypothetical protein